MTFVTVAVARLAPFPPITEATSPVLCVRFARKSEVWKKMDTFVHIHRVVLLEELCSLRTHPAMIAEVMPCEWTAYCAFAKSLVNLLGMGGGAKGSLLKQSLDHDTNASHFSDHFWTVHSDFIVGLSEHQNEGTPRFTKLPFGVDPKLLGIRSPQPSADPENVSNRMVLVEHINAYMPRYLTARLSKVQHADAFRTGTP
jgi:hypothetical protein